MRFVQHIKLFLPAHLIQVPLQRHHNFVAVDEFTDKLHEDEVEFRPAEREAKAVHVRQHRFLALIHKLREVLHPGVKRREVATNLAERRHVAPCRIHFNRKPLQVFSEFPRKDTVAVRDMIPRESRRAGERPGYFTHTGEAAVVEVLRVAVRAVCRMLRHLVVKRAFFGELVEAFARAVHNTAQRPLIVIQEPVDHRAVEF